MSLKEEFPEVGELVVGTIKRVTDYGAYANLDEYGAKEGLIHISEISTTWVRNIRNHVREGQKLVLKVLRVLPSRNQVDLSLRRVSGREKQEKMMQWKIDKKTDSIFKATKEKMKGSDKTITDIKLKIQKKYSNFYDAFEDVVDGGPEILQKLGISEEWAKVLTETAKSKIKIQKAKRTAVIELSSRDEKGIVSIKEILLKAAKIRKPKRSEINIYTIGAPKYRIEVIAGDYDSADALLNRSVEEALSHLKEFNLEGQRSN